MYFADEPEHVAILRETVRGSWLGAAARSAAALRPRAPLPARGVREARALGVCGLTIDEEYGGQGRDLIAAVAVIEELCRGGAFAAGPFIHCAFYGGINISENGSEEQKRALLPKLAQGELLFATASRSPTWAATSRASPRARGAARTGGICSEWHQALVHRRRLGRLHLLPRALGRRGGALPQSLVRARAARTPGMTRAPDRSREPPLYAFV
jgi:alkylation response protein AidB-like acyl-CoA dehydrogenase